MLTTDQPGPRPVAPAPDPAPIAGAAAGGLAALWAQLHSSERGLSSADAARRLLTAGANEPAPAPRRALITQILLAFANPLMIILLLAAAISAVVGEATNAAIIVVMVLLSVAVNFVQTYRSQRAAESLRQAVAPTASALRDGTWTAHAARRPRAGRRDPPGRGRPGARRRAAAGDAATSMCRRRR